MAQTATFHTPVDTALAAKEMYLEKEKKLFALVSCRLFFLFSLLDLSKMQGLVDRRGWDAFEKKRITK